MSTSYLTSLLVAWNLNHIACWMAIPSSVLMIIPAPLLSEDDDPSTSMN
jgi:hypothetical protein